MKDTKHFHFTSGEMASRNASADTSPTRNITSDVRADDEDREGPVREKLEETTIEEQQNRNSTEFTDIDMKEVPNSSDDRGRVRKKRSFDDVEGSETPGATKHVRKRSRDFEPPENPVQEKSHEQRDQTGYDTNEGGESLSTQRASEGRPTDSVSSRPTTPKVEKAPKEKEDSPARVTSEQTPASPSQTTTSGFTSSSIKSPFASLSNSKSIFSGAGTSNSSETIQSAFASASKSSPSPFSTLSPSKEKPPTTVDTSSIMSSNPSNEKLSFASASSTSSGFGALANKPSVFGGGLNTNSPFKNAITSAKLGSFASTSTGSIGNGFAIKPAKPFGKAADDNDDEDEDGGEGYDPEAAQVGTESEEKQDERFYERDVETGEEGEKTLFQCRARLFWMHENAWKERGLGTFKLNAAHIESRQEHQEVEREDGVEEDKAQAQDRSGEEEQGAAATQDESGQVEGRRDLVQEDAAAENGYESQGEESAATTNNSRSKLAARFIFRRDASHRMMLNSPITKEVELKSRATGKPAAIFTGFVEGKPAPCLLQVRNLYKT